MSLLTPTESVTASISSDAGALACHLRNAIHLANRIVGHVLDLTTTEINEWLNARPLAQRLAEFASHEETGGALNFAAALSEDAAGLAYLSLGRVDIRSVANKLAAQGRALEFGDDAFVVTDIPQPEPEPEPKS
jgi:hypothetical protein